MQHTISKDAINELPLKQFEGKVTVIEDPDRVPEIVEKLQKEKAIGFDTETKPSFKKGVSHDISLLQLSTKDEAYLFRLPNTGFNGALTKLMNNPKVAKVGVGIRDDIRGLKHLNNFVPKGFVELQEMAPKYGIEVLSLKNLAGLLLGFRVSKRQRLSNWEAQELSEGQILYAATDAWVSLEIYLKLKELKPVPQKPKETQPQEKSS
ncbi:3'-5' exonuclease [Marinilabilia salmonicolor]|jgi:ribonuclease D|uniref:3'-5' exonuclease n=1 Tax=Marinilabilia salmonicolor TaxID=989 RepID=A0A2T0XDN9_9BACT|nr:3'-5' exonuclease [Marinilabilia salmonicolor]PRY96990.1 3'-5' exonuclease [Marinilabilia salmonicolor]RCW36692.1 3'-5' exonuclease [Marinilabilia salmonicolor]